jgi:hypothetical protein
MYFQLLKQQRDFLHLFLGSLFAMDLDSAFLYNKCLELEIKVMEKNTKIQALELRICELSSELRREKRHVMSWVERYETVLGEKKVWEISRTDALLDEAEETIKTMLRGCAEIQKEMAHKDALLVAYLARAQKAEGELRNVLLQS